MDCCASDKTDVEHRYASCLTRDFESLLDDRIVISSRVSHCSNHIDFNYIHDQDMSYYQEGNNGSYYTNGHAELSEESILNGKSMLGDIPSTSKEDDYDPDLDQELTKLLEEEIKAIKSNSEQCEVKKEENDRKDSIHDAEEDEFEDYFDDFPTENDDSSIPEWYDQKRRAKMLLAKQNLKNLRDTLCHVSKTVDERIARIEKDHGTPLCKLDKFPKHPSFKKPWQNYWKFNCVLKCKLSSTEPNHAHTSECESVALEYYTTKTTSQSGNLCQNEIPHYVLHTVEVFQKFIEETTENYYRDHVKEDTIFEKPTWSYIKLRSNYKEELMMIVCGKGVSPLRMDLLKYFKSGPGRATNVVSLYYINLLGSKKKSGNIMPGFLYGVYTIKDKIGPISINYNPKTNTEFNSTEAALLGKNIFQYLAPCPDTTVLDIGCNSGTLSLMLAQKCDKVVGFSATEGDIKMAEQIKFHNRILNATFISCPPKDINTKVSIFVKKCKTVAIINLSTSFGKSADVMIALRNLPTVWRIAVYGTFESREHRNMITHLTTPDDNMGEEFMPMQGCVLDKFPSIDTEFDILVIFERKSLIEPTSSSLGSGPTVNLKEELWNHHPNFGAEKKTHQYKRGFGTGFDDGSTKPAPFKKHSKKMTMFDSPALPKEQSRAPVIKEDHTKIFGDFSSDLDPAALIDEDEPYVPLPVKKKEQQGGGSWEPLRVKSEDKLLSSKPGKVELKVLKKIYDCPSLPVRDRSRSPESKHYRDKPSSFRDRTADRSRRGWSPRGRDRSSSPELPYRREKTSASSRDGPTNRSRRDWSPRGRDRSSSPELPYRREKTAASSRDGATNRSRNDWSPRHRDRSSSPELPYRREKASASSKNKLSDRSRRDLSPRSRDRSDSPDLMYRKEKASTSRDKVTEKSRSNQLSIKTEKGHSRSVTIKVERRSPSIELEPRSDRSLLQHIKNENKTLPEKQIQNNVQTERRIKIERLTPPKSECQTNEQATRPIKKERNTSTEKENQTSQPHVVHIKKEKNVSPTDREEGELSPESIGTSPSVHPVEKKPVIKSEPMDIDDPPPKPMTPPVKREEGVVNNSALVDNVRVKAEPVSPVAPRIKTEPMDLKVSPISDTDEFANMETPVHASAALAQREDVSPPPSPTTNFTINGFQFCVKPNQTFLSVKAEPTEPEEPSSTPPHTSQVKQEPGTPEPIIIEEHKIKVEPRVKIEDKEQPKTPELQADDVEVIHVKSPKRIKVNIQGVVVKEKEDVSLRDDGDLRELIRKRNQLKKELGGDAVGSPSESCNRHSPSPAGKRYRSPASPGRPYMASRRPRSPSPLYRPRSPSPYSKRFRRSRSPSTAVDRYRWRSPAQQRFKASPPSRYTPPSPRYVRSPSPRYVRSPSPSRRRRSPSLYKPEQPGVAPKFERGSPPVRYRYSPPPERYRHSMRYSPPTLYKTKYLPPERYRHSRSPSVSSRAPRPGSPSSKSRHSPIRYDGSRSRSPIPRRKSKSSKRSRSPGSLSPSPSRDLQTSHRTKSRDKHHEKKKKKKKKRTVSSPDASAMKKKKKRVEDDQDEWDIPGLSCLEDSPVKGMKPKVPTSSEIFIDETEEMAVDLTEEFKDAPVSEVVEKEGLKEVEDEAVKEIEVDVETEVEVEVGRATEKDVVIEAQEEVLKEVEEETQEDAETAQS